MGWVVVNLTFCPAQKSAIEGSQGCEWALTHRRISE